MNASAYDPLANAQRSGYTQPGVADRYDAYRPRPPAGLPWHVSYRVRVGLK